MSGVTSLIDLIVQGKNQEAQELLNTELLTRSYSSIEEIRPKVAVDYFAKAIYMNPDGSIESDSDDENTETEEDSEE